jgi:hypothetical protein
MHTDEQLKRALAKMLPPKLIVWYRNPQFPSQAALRYCHNGVEVLDTELLHLCWLVETELSTQDWINYRVRLIQDLIIGRDISATWQQRTIALAKVLSIEIV